MLDATDVSTWTPAMIMEYLDCMNPAPRALALAVARSYPTNNEAVTENLTVLFKNGRGPRLYFDMANPKSVKQIIDEACAIEAGRPIGLMGHNSGHV